MTPRQPNSLDLDRQILNEIVDDLTSKYPRRIGFPQNVTLLSVHHIRDTPRWRSVYDRFLASANDTDKARRSLHSRIGRIVKKTLGARVVGRSKALDPSLHLIKSHALLVP